MGMAGGEHGAQLESDGPGDSFVVWRGTPLPSFAGLFALLLQSARPENQDDCSISNGEAKGRTEEWPLVAGCIGLAVRHVCRQREMPRVLDPPTSPQRFPSHDISHRVSVCDVMDALRHSFLQEDRSDTGYARELGIAEAVEWLMSKAMVIVSSEATLDWDVTRVRQIGLRLLSSESLSADAPSAPPAAVQRRLANPVLGLPLDAVRKTMTEALLQQQAGLDVPPLPGKRTGTVRVVTYNVHFFQHPFRGKCMAEIIASLVASRADVVLLQEMREVEEATGLLVASGFSHYVLGEGGFNLTNAIFSRFPLDATSVIPLGHDPLRKEPRAAVAATVLLPTDGTSVPFPIFCTHLDVHDETGDTRRRQVVEIMAAAEARGLGGHMIAGDFNAVRQQDYGPEIWQIMQQQNADRGLGPVVTQAMDAVGDAGYTDAFDVLQLDPPTATVWSLRRVDFLLLSPHWVGGETTCGEDAIRLAGAYVLHLDHSDHIPLVADFAIV